MSKFRIFNFPPLIPLLFALLHSTCNLTLVYLLPWVRDIVWSFTMEWMPPVTGSFPVASPISKSRHEKILTHDNKNPKAQIKCLLFRKVDHNGGANEPHGILYIWFHIFTFIIRYSIIYSIIYGHVCKLQKRASKSWDPIVTTNVTLGPRARICLAMNS